MAVFRFIIFSLLVIILVSCNNQENFENEYEKITNIEDPSIQIIDRVIEDLEKEDKNIIAYMDLVTLPYEYTELVLNKLNEKALIDPDQSKWFYYMGKVIFHKYQDYPKSIEYFEKAYEIIPKPVYLLIIEDCKERMEEEI